MVKPHRAIFERVGDRPAVLLDTPYGFQSNADDISGKAVGYFASSVGHEISVVSWRTPPSDAVVRERAVASLRDAGWAFAGPGSPTYTLRQWRETPEGAHQHHGLDLGGGGGLANPARMRRRDQ